MVFWTFIIHEGNKQFWLVLYYTYIEFIGLKRKIYITFNYIGFQITSKNYSKAYTFALPSLLSDVGDPKR